MGVSSVHIQGQSSGDMNQLETGWEALMQRLQLKQGCGGHLPGDRPSWKTNTEGQADMEPRMNVMSGGRRPRRVWDSRENKAKETTEKEER